jgi:hypothetical protein
MKKRTKNLLVVVLVAALTSVAVNALHVIYVIVTWPA